MRTFPVYARLSHTYRAGWSHLDRHEYATTVRLTKPRLLSLDDYGSAHSVLNGRISAKQREQARSLWEKLPRKERLPFKPWLASAIATTFDSGCQCEHDCCGHYQSYAIAHIYGRRVVVSIHSYRNL